MPNYENYLKFIVELIVVIQKKRFETSKQLKIKRHEGVLNLDHVKLYQYIIR